MKWYSFIKICLINSEIEINFNKIVHTMLLLKCSIRWEKNVFENEYSLQHCDCYKSQKQNKNTIF